MAETAIMAIGLVGMAVGGGVSYTSQQRMVREQTTASKRAEAAREQQMQLDAQRRRRQAIREGLMARSMNLAIGAAQGAQGSSSLASATGGATGMAMENQQGITSAEVIGGRVFGANRDYFNASQRGQAGMAMGNAISSLGGALVSNAGTISRLGEYYTNRPQTA